MGKAESTLKLVPARSSRRIGSTAAPLLACALIGCALLLSLRSEPVDAVPALLGVALLLSLPGLRRQHRHALRRLPRLAAAASGGHETPSPTAAETERRWRALAALSADWFWETDSEHRLSWVSPSAPSLSRIGWDDSQLIGRRRDEIAFYDPPALGWQEMHARLDRREPVRDIEFRIRTPNGQDAMWVSISGRARHDSNGAFAGYEGVARDISERKAGHERLSASEQRWSLMTGLAADWYWETDAEHRLCGPMAELSRRFPAFRQRYAGRTRWAAHGDALTPAQWAAHRADLDAHRPFRSLQFQIEDRPGRFLWLSISGIPRFDGSGLFVGYHGVGRDITARKQAEQLLLRHNQALQQAVAERTQELEQRNVDLDAFARQLAHELRTPLAHIEGLADLLQQRAAARLTADDRRLIGLQRTAAHDARQTADALLQLARSAVQPLALETVDVSALAAEAAAGLEPLARCAAVEWSIAPGLVATASPAALRIVLNNLLGNAAKFTRQAERPRIGVVGAIDADGRLRIGVQDNGVGFDPAEAERLFTPFTRLHAGHEFHGSGVGLSIVQRIVERHGGSVAARGAPGAGARFEFTLQAAATVPTAA